MLALRSAVLVFCLSAASPAWADKAHAVTPSGATEMQFGIPPEQVSGKIASLCLDRKWTVVTSTPSEVVCQAPMSFGQSFMGQLLMGNSYSTPPRQYFKFTVTTVEGRSRVQASGWMELQMAFGQMKRTDYSGASFHNGAMAFMESAGGAFPKGTTFPNHAFFGVSFSGVVANGKFSRPIVKATEAGGAAETGGLQPGDQIDSIAGKRLKDQDDIYDALEKATAKPTFSVAIIRGGKAMTLSLPVMYRSPIATEVAINAPAAPQPSAAAQPSLLVADELLKLVKLKDAGVLSEQEFLAQKARLLAQ